MSKLKKFIISIIITIIVLFVLIILAYNYGISAVSKDSMEVEFEVTENSTYLSLSTSLKEKDLIKSELFYKIYIKLNNPSKLQKGNYILNKNMSVDEIINKLENNLAFHDTVSFVIPEGKRIEDVSKILSSVTKYKESDWLNYWNSEELLDKLINKYWFITNEVKNTNLRYNLEGYFFPDTYEIYKDSTMEEVTYKMLDRMDEILSKYKDNITNNTYTVHELLTLASIVEYEAILDEDRPIIAGVFLNRLDKGMLLQSCATVGYAIDDWKLTYTYSDLQTESLYNTYKYVGLPVGPGGLAGEKSINAVLNPTKTSYLYFLANVYDSSSKKTYYSNTYPEHQQKCREYLGKEC